MDDLISKNKLILYLNDWRFGVAPDETTPIKDQDRRLVMASTIYDCMLTVENFPTVAIPAAEPKWIPVRERLPEDRRTVLVTAYWHETYQVMEASYFGDGLWWCVPFNNCGEHLQRLKPKAWMPLPKPYEPQGSEG